ncbi:MULTISPECIES: FAD:protein FMN transferase [unclassified Shewanella]|uniref:FAD:protein FMN transferase n=1 Tax=unclassified Shewanella TaxID=196818 RepID=UPI0035544CB8
MTNANAQDMRTVHGQTMGNKYKVTWKEDKITAAKMANIRSQIEVRLETVNQSMSTWRQNSEISLINQAPKNTPIKISADFERVIIEAIRIAELTNNTLDVTVGPLVNLWGFGPDGRIQDLPSDQAIIDAKKSIGIQHIQLTNHSLTKSIDGLYIDLSSIAKGYGVDVIAEVMEQNNIHNYLVDIGGELRIKGLSLDNQEWTVGIDKPFAYSSGQMEIITPGNSAVATSGDYRKYFENNGQHFSHLIDPRSGRPVSHTVVSATVIEQYSMTADALATAFMVLSVQESLAIANEHQIPIMLIEDKFGKLITHHSESFKKYIKN